LSREESKDDLTNFLPIDLIFDLFEILKDQQSKEEEVHLVWEAFVH
jgi:hypothetical protein